jgi:hypothetical protein
LHPGQLARAKFRDFDGIVRPAKRSGKTKAAAERALRTALVERQARVKQSEITAQTKIEQVAELWLMEIEQAVEAGSKSPSTLDAYRTNYRRHVMPALGGLRVREVDTPAVDRVLTAIKDNSQWSADSQDRDFWSDAAGHSARHGEQQPGTRHGSHRRHATAQTPGADR